MSKKFKIGHLFKDGAYKLVSADDKRLTCMRMKKKTLFIVTRKMIADTQERIDNGEEITFRTISYTSAIEHVVIKHCTNVVSDAKRRVYRKRGS